MKKLVLFSSFLVLINVPHIEAQMPDHFVVTNEIMVEKPLSPLLYSNFIELGYGIQVEPMWGEMLWNRSFEAFVPYKGINIIWYDLFNDPKDHSKGYKRDWTSEDWYHSGYEHNAWFAAPGKAGRLPIDGESTFFINETPGSTAVLSQEQGGVHGTQYLVAANRGEVPTALGQEGKFLNARSSYIFRGHFRSDPVPADLELRIYKEGDWQDPLVTVPFRVESSDNFQLIELLFHNPSYCGRATFSIWIPGGARVSMDALSLMPKNAIGGWRPEAVAAADYVKPGVVRFPGGCFASFYNWRDGIGPHDSRKPQPSYFWGGLNYNDVGVAELAQYCKAIGSEMMYCVNVYHPFKEEWDHRWDDGTGFKMGFEFPHFTDIEKGAREATLSGVLSGYPLVDLKINLVGGSYKENLSSPLAYKIAASTALREGCQKAKPLLLEPIMKIEIVLPNEFVGEVIGNLNARGGKVKMIDAKGKISIIDAKAPLKRMFGYTTSLRSETQGRGSFTMHFSHYDTVD